MKQVVIENPILNSPFEEPERDIRFSNEGITDEIVEDRRESPCFIPIAPPKKKTKQQQALFETQWTRYRIEKNKLINDIRARVGVWRTGGYGGLTKTSARLLDYWDRADRHP